MHVDHALRNGEAEPQPAIFRSDGAAPLLEGVEDPRLHVCFDPDAGVGEIDHDAMLSVVAGSDAQLATRRRELHGVLNDVPEDLLQPRRVGPAVMLAGC